MQAPCLATLQKVEGRSTFLATRNATIPVAKWGVTHEFFLATCNATFVALQVARNIAPRNMAYIHTNRCNDKKIQMNSLPSKQSLKDIQEIEPRRSFIMANIIVQLQQSKPSY